MVLLAYISFTLIATVFGAVLGYVGHYWRAHFTYTAEDLGLGEPWDSLTREDYQFEKHVVGAKWDDNGFWDDSSNRNLCYMVVSGAAAPLIASFVFFGSRSEIVSGVCLGLSSLGLNSPVCPL
jgi:hypothetical protein